VPRHPRLEAHIDTSPAACTSLLVDRYLDGAHRAWALVGAHGDNMEVHDAMALRDLGIALNYNGYGESLADLHFHPVDLHRRMRGYADPLAFAREDASFRVLSQAYREDMSRAAGLEPVTESPHAALYVLPDAAWARRVAGVLASRLARAAPARAHAVALPARGGWQVSVRAPLERPRGAAALCRAWESGGGREGAAGINYLPSPELARFAARFLAHFRGEGYA
jgi:hypothetical protein